MNNTGMGAPLASSSDGAPTPVTASPQLPIGFILIQVLVIVTWELI